MFDMRCLVQNVFKITIHSSPLYLTSCCSLTIIKLTVKITMCSRHQLCVFNNHFTAMTVVVHLGTNLWVIVKIEYIHPIVSNQYFLYSVEPSSTVCIQPDNIILRNIRNVKDFILEFPNDRRCGLQSLLSWS